MVIKVRLLGFFQMMLGTMYLDMEIPAGESIRYLWESIVDKYVQLQKEDMSRIAGISVNGEYIHQKNWNSFLLKKGDMVDLLTQMGGG